MNERINNLFGQALDEAVPETWTTLDADQLSRLKEKFAELIVEQMVDLLMIQHGAVASAHNYYAVAANLIRAEFGVDE